MPSSIISGTSKQNIILILAEQYDAWVKSQSTAIQQWLVANSYKGKGHILLPPNSEGGVQVLQCIPSFDDFFLAADLANALPEGDYSLDISELEKASSFDSNTSKTLIFRYAVSWALSAYQFTRYKEPTNTPANLAVEDAALLAEIQDTAEAIYLTRDLINTPAGDMMPQHLAEIMLAMATTHQGTFSEIVGDELLTQNYPMIHAVGRASVHEPRLLELCWGDKSAPAITLVGKGICFDSGGLNIKTGNFMRQMKKDMGGAAHVLGLAQLIMAQKLPVRLRVLVAAAENAISGNALRPGDVVTSRKGLTVEIDNTDAEGRLVLCDALDDASNETPELIIDFATLTGACRVALGTELPGFFCNDEEVAAALTKSSVESLDPIWRLPLHKPYNDLLKSHFADTLNSAEVGFGGAITAALYLEKFINNSVPWVHFDVMAWNIRALPGRPVGGEALGLRAVFDYLKSRYH